MHPTEQPRPAPYISINVAMYMYNVTEKDQIRLSRCTDSPCPDEQVQMGDKFHIRFFFESHLYIDVYCCMCLFMYVNDDIQIKYV